MLYRIYHKLVIIKAIFISLEEVESVSKELNILSKLKCDFAVKFINLWFENNFIKAGDYMSNNCD